MTRATSDDSDQPGHPPSLIRVFAVRMTKLGSLPRLIWAFDGRTCNFVDFDMRWLNYYTHCHQLPFVSVWWFRGAEFMYAFPFLDRLVLQSKYIHLNFLQVVVHMIIIDQWNQTARLYEIEVTIIFNRAILVALTSECHVKTVIWQTWTGILTNSADADQTPQNAASDLGLYCLFKLQEVKG